MVFEWIYCPFYGTRFAQIEIAFDDRTINMEATIGTFVEQLFLFCLQFNAQCSVYSIQMD